jgi:hypothetical protein
MEQLQNQEAQRICSRMENMRRLASLTLASLALLPSSAIAARDYAKPITANNPHLEAVKGEHTSNVPALPSAPDLPVPQGRHLELCVADEKAVYHDTEAQVEKVVSDAKAMGATCWRVMLKLKYLHENGWSRFDLMQKALDQNGLKTNITLNMNGAGQSDAEIAQDVTEVVTHYPKGTITDLAYGNEPNITGIDPCDYRRQYDIAEQAVHDLDPNIKMVNGTVTAYGGPLYYLQREMECPSTYGGPLYADAIGINPYQFIGPPTDPSPPDNSFGVGSLGAYSSWLAAQYLAGRVQTRQGLEPKIVAQEFAYWQDTRGKKNDPNVSYAHRQRYLDPQIAADYYQQALGQFCAYPDVGRVTLYELQAQEMTAPTDWESGQEDQNGQPLPSYFAIQDYKQNHLECFVNDSMWLSHPLLSRRPGRIAIKYPVPQVIGQEQQPAKVIDTKIMPRT